MNTLKKERIALEIIKTLKSRFDNFPEDASDNRNAPFHEAFLEAFKIISEKTKKNPILKMRIIKVTAKFRRVTKLSFLFLFIEYHYIK